MEEEIDVLERAIFSKKIILISVLNSCHPGIIYSVANQFEKKFPDVVIDVFGDDPIKNPIGILCINNVPELTSSLQFFLDYLASHNLIQKPDSI